MSVEVDKTFASLRAETGSIGEHLKETYEKHPGLCAAAAFAAGLAAALLFFISDQNNVEAER